MTLKRGIVQNLQRYFLKIYSAFLIADCGFTILDIQYINKILTFVDDESQKRSVWMQQKADSVRYLNELNMVFSFFFLAQASLYIKTQGD